jgi:hypothetical protein
VWQIIGLAERRDGRRRHFSACDNKLKFELLTAPSPKVTAAATAPARSGDTAFQRLTPNIPSPKELRQEKFYCAYDWMAVGHVL